MWHPMPTPWKELISPSSAFTPVPMNQANHSITSYPEADYLPQQFYCTPHPFQTGCHHGVLLRSPQGYSSLLDDCHHVNVMLDHEAPYFPDIEVPVSSISSFILFIFHAI